MANKAAYVLQTGVNNYLTPALAFNKHSTDTLTPGVVGAIFNTAGVAPATGAFAANAQGSPNMTVAISAGSAYVNATPTSGTAQNIAVTSDASENVTIAANATGSTRYDFIYIKVDADKMNNPAATGLDAVTFVTQRSTTQTVDSNGALANGLLIAEVTVANGASSIANASIADRRLLINSSIDGWQNANETWTYASATTITVPTGAAFKYSVGDKVRIIQSGSTKYFYITGVTDTVITVNGGSDYTVANASIGSPCYSKRVSPVGFPANGFAFTPTWTASGTAVALGNGTLSGQFQMSGKWVTFRMWFLAGNTTTFGTGNYTFALPVSISSYWSVGGPNRSFAGTGYAEDAGVQGYMLNAGRLSSGSGATKFSIQQGTSAAIITQTAPFTWANGDYFDFAGTYEAA